MKEGKNVDGSDREREKAKEEERKSEREKTRVMQSTVSISQNFANTKKMLLLSTHFSFVPFVAQL